MLLLRRVVFVRDNAKFFFQKVGKRYAEIYFTISYLVMTERI